MQLPPLEWIPSIVAEGRRLARRMVGPGRSPTAARLPCPQPQLIHGDGLEAMAGLLAGNGGAMAYRGRLDLVWIEADGEAGAADQASAWLARLAAQLVLARTLLRRRGECWIDIDRDCADHARLLLDALYGSEAFVVEIAWQPQPETRRAAFAYLKQGQARRRPDEMHDDGYIRQRFPNVEPGTGRRYWLDPATWRHDQARLERMRAEGRIVTSRSGMPYIKRYFTDDAGMHSAPRPARRLDMGPAAGPLLARAVRHACPQGGVVAAFGKDRAAFALAASRLGLDRIDTGSGGDAGRTVG